MFKKMAYFTFVIGLFSSTTLYAHPATISANDGTLIREFVFYGGADFINGKSYPVTVKEDNVTALVPFPSSMRDGGPFKYIYDIKVNSGVYVWLGDLTTNTSVEIGMGVDNHGALVQTICESGRQAEIYIQNCDVSILNGIATMNVYFHSK